MASKIFDEKLADIIALCDPEQAAMTFSSGGVCGNEGLFKFCMYMKDEFLNVEDAMPFIKKWYEKWQDKLIDETGYKLALEDVEVQAEDLWDKIKYGVGGQLYVARMRADGRSSETIPELEDYGGEPERLLAITCYELHCLVKMKKEIFISSYDAAEIMGLDRVEGQKRAYRALRVFIHKGILMLVKRGNRNRATRYLYTGSPPVKIDTALS